MFRIPIALALGALLSVSACSTNRGAGPSPSGSAAVPTWASDAVFYQIFPERFANGDRSNDPTRQSLEEAGSFAPTSWRISDWTADWYARADWEEELGPDFYNNGVFQRRYGGDLQGVINRLGYLDSLGINAIYFNPVFYARSLHKYDASSYHHIDPYFGPDPEGDLKLIEGETFDPQSWHWTAADRLFLELLQEARQHGIRVIIDGVWNHTGRSFFAFADLIRNQEQSAYRDWYVVNAFDDPATAEDEFEYESWWNSYSLPVFADTPDSTDLHPGPKQYIFDATRRWMDPDGDGDPSDGIDGWRLDVTEDVPVKFWSDWNTLVRELNPEAYTVSEIWGDASSFIRNAGFSATMNYHAFALPVKAFLVDEAVPADEFVRLLEDRRDRYDEGVRPALQNLVDSHDTPRIATMIVNADSDYRDPEWFDYDRDVSPRGGNEYSIRKPNDAQRRVQRLVALFQMTYEGAPMIYYGTEAGMWGADDPDDRMPMVWPERAFDDQVMNPDGTRHDPDEVAFDEELFNYFRDVIGMRLSHPALTSAETMFIDVDDETRAVSFIRGTGADRVLVVINRGDRAVEVVVSATDFSPERPVVLAASAPGATFDTRRDSADNDNRIKYFVARVPPISGAAFGNQVLAADE